MNQDHLVRELKQILFIEEKLNQIFESTNNEDRHIQLPQLINNLEVIGGSVTILVKEISSKKTTKNYESLTSLAHEFRTPLTPINAYTDMLLKGHFGKLTDEQQARIEVINSNAKQLQNTTESLLNSIANPDISVKNSQHNTERHTKELEQEKILLKKINELLSEKVNQTIKEKEELEDSLIESNRKKREAQQEKLLLNNEVRVGEQKSLLLAKKNLIIITVSAVVVGIGFTAYSLYVVELIGQQYQISNLGNLQSNYVIQNLQGDTIDTWLSWRIVSGQTLHVGIIDSKKYPDKVELIKGVVLSEESINIDDSLLHKGPQGSTSIYYLGWTGALKQAAKTTTHLGIPQNFQVIETTRGEGDITIILTDEKSGDGYSGYTKSIADSTQNQILKSTITIYEIDKLTDNQFKTILRHEFGHAIGLAHSTAPEDLMAPTIQTQYPYISDCDIDSIVKLYDGEKKSHVTCEK